MKIVVFLRKKTKYDVISKLQADYISLFNKELPDDRVEFILGDLKHTKLGLSELNYSLLVSTISIVVHAAANVNHLKNYQALYTDNVLSTYNLLLFTQQSSSNIHYISTLFDLPTLQHAKNISLIETLNSGYEKTKYAAEILIENAIEKKYPAFIYRLPILLGKRCENSEKLDHFEAFLNACKKLKCIPNFNIGLNLFPVELAAKYIKKRILNEFGKGKVRNMVVGKLKLTDVVKKLSKQYSIDTVNLWISKLDKLADTDDFYRLKALYTNNPHDNSDEDNSSCDYDCVDFTHELDENVDIVKKEIEQYVIDVLSLDNEEVAANEELGY